jgi:hypothetical protein
MEAYDRIMAMNMKHGMEAWHNGMIDMEHERDGNAEHEAWKHGSMTASWSYET